MRLNLLQPVRDIVKRALLCAVVHKNDAHSTLVVCLGDRPESLLPRCIPNLKLYSLILHVNRLDFEVDS